MNRIGVFLRCTGIDDVPQALATLRDRVGVHRIQISKLPDESYSPAGIAELGRLLDDAGMRADAVTIVHDGESYADIETVRRTVGYLPPHTQEERIAYSRRCIELAAGLGAPIVTTHMGMLPADPHDAGYGRLVQAVRSVAAYASTQGVTLALETGQETAEDLMTFLERIPDVPVGINYDPANLIIYGMDDPVGSLHTLRDHVVGFHIKDAVPAESPDQLGREVSPGQGVAAVGDCIRHLLETGYSGSFIIENYVARHGSRDDKLRELQAAKEFVAAIVSPYLGQSDGSG